MSDDDFKIAEEKNEEFKLQPDAQFGLKFVHDESQQDAYALSSKEYDASTSTPNDATRGSANDAPAIKAPESADEPDVYGIVEPTPSPELQEDASAQSRGEQDVRSSKSKKGKKKSDNKSNDKFDDESVSLEEVYERKRRERERYGDETYANVELPPLPARPFWDGIFKPFLDLGFVVRALASIGAAYFPICCAIYFLDYSFAGEVKEMLAHNDGANALNVFYECLWKDKILVSVLCLFWAVFAVPFVENVFMTTATGSDKIDEWSEYNFVSGLGSFLMLALYVGIACIPGVLLFSAFGLPRNVGAGLSALCLTPIFILSCVQNDAPFAIVSKDVLVGVKRLQKEWFQFWGISLIIILACLILELFAIWHSVGVNSENVKPEIPRVAFSGLIVSSVVTFGPCLYFRYLGRFAWILETDFRKRREEEEERKEGVDKTKEEN